jgi:glycosyltransferase involved in cell wall biosynthesis
LSRADSPAQESDLSQLGQCLYPQRQRPSSANPAGAFVFAYLGRLLAEHNGLDMFVKAFARIPESSGVYLVLIGPDHDGGSPLCEVLPSSDCGSQPLTPA